MNFIDKLQIMSEDSGLDFMSLLKLSDGIKINDVELVQTTFGMASDEEIFIDFDKIMFAISQGYIDYDKALFIMYHEVAHHKRIHKLGVKEHMNRITNPDVKIFIDYTLNEEIFADRWASFVFYLNNNREYPRIKTQCLDDKDKSDKYKKKLMGVHPLFIGKTKDDYHRVIKNFIKNVR